jgi:hypothetical protein
LVLAGRSSDRLQNGGEVHERGEDEDVQHTVADFEVIAGERSGVKERGNKPAGKRL